MKFVIIALALLGAVSADVAHLNNMYLPPHMAKLFEHKHVEYVEQSQEIPQVSTVEITDNSVSAPEPAVDETHFMNRIDIETLNNMMSSGDNVETHTHTEEHKPSHEDSATTTITTAETSVPESTFHTVTTESENKYHTGLIAPSQSTGASSTSTTVVTKTETKSESTAPAHETEETKTEEKVEVAEEDNGRRPYLEILGPTVKPSVPAEEPSEDKTTETKETEVKHSTVTVHHEEHHDKAPTPGSDIITHTSHTTTVDHHEEEASAPAVVASTSSSSSSSSSSSGVETQYGSNGGYVY